MPRASRPASDSILSFHLAIVLGRVIFGSIIAIYLTELEDICSMGGPFSGSVEWESEVGGPGGWSGSAISRRCPANLLFDPNYLGGSLKQQIHNKSNLRKQLEVSFMGKKKPWKKAKVDESLVLSR